MVQGVHNMTISLDNNLYSEKRLIDIDFQMEIWLQGTWKKRYFF